MERKRRTKENGEDLSLIKGRPPLEADSSERGGQQEKSKERERCVFVWPLGAVRLRAAFRCLLRGDVTWHYLRAAFTPSLSGRSPPVGPQGEFTGLPVCPLAETTTSSSACKQNLEVDSQQLVSKQLDPSGCRPNCSRVVSWRNSPGEQERKKDEIPTI